MWAAAETQLEHAGTIPSRHADEYRRDDRSHCVESPMAGAGSMAFNTAASECDGTSQRTGAGDGRNSERRIQRSVRFRARGGDLGPGEQRYVDHAREQRASIVRIIRCHCCCRTVRCSTAEAATPMPREECRSRSAEPRDLPPAIPVQGRSANHHERAELGRLWRCLYRLYSERRADHRGPSHSPRIGDPRVRRERARVDRFVRRGVGRDQRHRPGEGGTCAAGTLHVFMLNRNGVPSTGSVIKIQ